MRVLITYDVETSSENGARRLRRVAKECVNYGHRVQNSVFECVVNESQLSILRQRLEKEMDKKSDSIRIYHLGNELRNKVEVLGKNTDLNVIGDLII